MSHSCRLLCGFLMSCIGWTGIILATSTNNWVVTCKFGMHTCKKMEELETKSLWTECMISTAVYHCVSLNQILKLPAYIQTSRALMVTASLLGLPSLTLALLAMPCVKLNQDTEDTKYKRAVLGGILILFISLCGIVSTVWFPIGVLHEDGLMSFGFSLYAGWVGSALCFFGGSLMTCCSKSDGPSQSLENRYYYSKHSGVSSPPINSHAKSAHVWEWRQTHMDKDSAHISRWDLGTHTWKLTHLYPLQWNMWRICFPMPWFERNHVKIWREQRIGNLLKLADIEAWNVLFEQTLQWNQGETISIFLMFGKSIFLHSIQFCSCISFY